MLWGPIPINGITSCHIDAFSLVIIQIYIQLSGFAQKNHLMLHQSSGVAAPLTVLINM